MRIAKAEQLRIDLPAMPRELQSQLPKASVFIRMGAKKADLLDGKRLKSRLDHRLARLQVAKLIDSDGLKASLRLRSARSFLGSRSHLTLQGAPQGLCAKQR